MLSASFLALIFCIHYIAPLESLSPKDSSSDIAGGTQAVKGQFPFQVIVTDKKYFCTGSLIRPNWVLTTASCAGPIKKNLVVIPGELKLTTSAKPIKSKSTYLHKKFNGTINDIALIKLEKSIENSTYVGIIKLANANFSETSKVFTVSGWGSQIQGQPAQENLMWTYIDGISVKECRNRFPSVNNSTLCANRKNNGPCTGDAGAPLVFKSGSDQTLVGLTSLISTPCGNGPSIFTRVSYYENWIKDTIGNSSAAMTFTVTLLVITTILSSIL